MPNIRQVSPKSRPREKLLRLGAEHLSDSELLATILGTGTKGKDVILMAKEVLREINGPYEKLEAKQLIAIHGMGQAKAIQILAAQEFFRRRTCARGSVIESPQDILPHLRTRIASAQEYFLCTTLNGAQELIQIRTITIGILDRVQIHPREVFADAISDRAAAVILAHNHPSQFLEPSEADRKINKTLIGAGKLLGIQVIDHLIFNNKNYFSMREHRCGGFR